jgi:hypothetical protein
MLAKRLTLALVTCSTIAVACDTRGLSYGDPNSIIAVMSPALWEEASEPVYAELEQTIVTVRDEKAFTVTYQAPYAEYWNELRRFRQLLLVGALSDAWIQEALDQADVVEEPVTGPGLYQVGDVWSLGQTVTLVILPDGGGAQDLRPHLPAIHAILDEQYRAYARSRMYLSGVDSALADTLATEAGFALTLPRVYRWMRTDSTFLFRNDNPDPSELIREIVVTWRSPAPAELGVDELLAWRAELVRERYTEPQDFVAEGMAVDASPFTGHAALEVRAQWRNPPDRGWPAGGPIITRAITCDNQDRTYLIDAWLYAPGKEKYEYMIQLETLLDTFRCE